MMYARTLVVLLVVSAAGLATVPGSTVADVEGRPNLDATLTDNRVTPGEDTTVEVTLVNRGKIREADPQDPRLTDRVTQARDLTVSMDSGSAPIEVRTGRHGVGTLPEGASSPLAFEISVDEDAEAGTYRVPVRVSYTYTQIIDKGDGDEVTRDRTERLRVTLEIDDDARVEVRDVSTNARVGSSGTVDVTVENTGTVTANETELRLESPNGDLTFGGSASASRSLGDWAPNETRTVEYTVTPSETADPQPYSVDLTAIYRDENGILTESETRSIAVRPDPQQTFSVQSTDSTVAVGDTGTLTVNLTNDGPIAVSEATVDIAATSPNLNFGGSESTSRFVGEWAPGETRTVEYDVTATDDADTRNYALDVTVSYRDADDDVETAPTRSLGLEPEPEQSFAISDVSSNLSVGSEGRLRGTVRNTGEGTAGNAVVQFLSESSTVTAIESDAPVGDLEPGESARFSLPLEISESAESGPKQYTLSVRYRNQDGDERESDTVDVQQPVGPDDPEFALSTENATVAPGQSTQIEMTVTNVDNKTFTDISANLFTDDPISTGDDEAFISRLEPGESTTVVFSVSSAGSALTKSYPLSIDFQYDEPDGDTVVSDTYRRSLVVEESDSDGGGLPLPIIAVAIVVLAVGAVLVYRRYG